MEKTMNFLKINLNEFINSENKKFNVDKLPQAEVNVFINALKLVPELITKFDPRYFKFNKEEIERWSIIYLNIHNLFHSEINENEIEKLEILTTAPIFIEVTKIIPPEDQEKLNAAYFILGVAALKINHKLEHLISEKIILGEFISLGGIEESIWGLKLNHQILTSVAKNILEKTENNNHYCLVKRYKNFILDYL
jgi:hypothetical protein